MVSSFQAPSQPIAKGARTTVAVVPGAFKPPHKGHMAMVEHYSAIANKVVVFISPLSRPIPGGGEVTFEESKAIWNLYIENSGLSNVVVSSIPSTFNSPVQAAYEFAANESQKPEWLQAGEHIIYGASDKPDKKEIPDFMRFKGGDKYVREDAYGGALEETQDKAFKVSLAGPALSASDLRAVIGAGDAEKIDLYVPPGVDPQAILDILGVKEPTEEEPFTMEDIMEIVNQELDEISQISAGDVESGAMGVSKRGRGRGPFKGTDIASFNKKQKEDAKLKRKKKKKKIDEDEMVSTILDYLVNKGMAQ
jgi:cytidyltransferase-like protein